MSRRDAMESKRVGLHRGLVAAAAMAFAAAAGAVEIAEEITIQAAPALRGQLTAVNARGTLTASAITGKLRARGFAAYTAKYGAACKQLVYGTLATDGALLNASALICVPKRPAGASSPILSYNHGTIVSDADAPSTSGSAQYTMAQGVAGLGYISVMPDYVGYGASADRLHPYLHAQTLAAATVDAVRAARRYLQRNAILTNGKVFLAGYSEGGYAAFATQRSMEQEFPGEFAVTASAPGAGPYNLLQTAADMMSMATLPSTIEAPFLITAYDHTYQPVSRLADYFRAPYDANANFAFDGTRTAAEVNALFTRTTAKLFNEPFLSQFRGEGETELKAWLAENNLHDNWIPQSKTRLFHGRDDTTVPYANAIAVKTHAVTAPDLAVVECTTDAGVKTNHANCAKPYWLFIFNFFGSLKPGL